MRAVNLIPREARRGGGGRAGLPSLGPGYLVLAVLAIIVGFVTVLVLTNNTISSRKAQVASLNTQVTAEKALAARLVSYEQFAQLAQARAQTVRQIVSGRFDWHSALSDLSKVVPANTRLQSLNATVSPTAGASSSGASASSLRGAINAPAFDVTGCTQTQDDVARVISRLRTMNGVTRVTLQDSAKGGAQTGVTASATSSSGSSSCGGGPTFHLVVFFQPTSAGAGATPATSQTVSTTSTGGTK